MVDQIFDLHSNCFLLLSWILRRTFLHNFLPGTLFSIELFFFNFLMDCPSNPLFVFDCCNLLDVVRSKLQRNLDVGLRFCFDSEVEVGFQEPWISRSFSPVFVEELDCLLVLITNLVINVIRIFVGVTDANGDVSSVP